MRPEVQPWYSSRRTMRSKWTNNLNKIEDKDGLMADDVACRFLGGPPLAVLARLVLLSVVVGVILSAVGLDPWNLLRRIEKVITNVWDMGVDALRCLWRYFLLGAALVVPIWLLVRLTRGAAGRG